MSAAKDPVVTLRNVGVCFRRHAGILRRSSYWALQDISLDVLHGEVLGLIGRNGAGKSTVLRVLADIIRPDRGTMARSPDYTASLLTLQIGFVPYLTGRENVYLGGMLLGMSRRMLRSQIDAIIGFSELEEFIDDPVWTYSVGMRARLGFAVVHAANPDIMLLDEMLGVGDAAFREKSRRAMTEKIRSNRTVVLVSHSMETVRDLCDRVAWIDSGRIVQSGTPDEVIPAYERTVPRAALLRHGAAPDLPGQGGVRQ